MVKATSKRTIWLAKWKKVCHLCSIPIPIPKNSTTFPGVGPRQSLRYIHQEFRPFREANTTRTARRDLIAEGSLLSIFDECTDVMVNASKGRFYRELNLEIASNSEEVGRESDFY